MSISRRLLHPDEHVVFSTRTHVKALLWPAVLLIVVAALAGFLSTLPSGDAAGIVRWVIWVVALVLILWWCVLPFLRWLTATYTVTDRRLITRSGILTRRGHDIPLGRISDVSYEHGLIDRMLGCGTLIVSDASEQGRVSLPDIPDVERMHLTLSDLLFAGPSASTPKARRFDDGT